MSAYVLSRVLPAPQCRFEEILRAIGDDREPRFALAELNDLLAGLVPIDFDEAAADAELGTLSPYLQNHVAAMVELAAYQKSVGPPSWVCQVEPLAEPRFATSLRSLRWHLIRAAPVPFRRRNIFIDSGVGERV